MFRDRPVKNPGCFGLVMIDESIEESCVGVARGDVEVDARHEVNGEDNFGEIEEGAAENLHGVRLSGYGLQDKRFETGDGFKYLVAQVIPVLQITCVIDADPDFAVGILPGQRLKREINRCERRCQHNRRAALGVSEDQQLRGRHGEADFGSFATVIDAGEDGDVLCAQDGFEAVESFGNRVGAGVGDQAVGGHWGAPGRSVSGMSFSGMIFDHLTDCYKWWE